MKDSSWEDCIESNSAIKVTPNKQKAMSLVEVAEGRINVFKMDLNEKTANYIFEDYYTSVLEFVQAIVFLKGYKVNNHICLGFFLRDFLKKEELFRTFDDCRFKRNSLMYYGKKMDFEVAKEAINKSKSLLSELRVILKDALKSERGKNEN
ncbi:MAG: hypothetical protein AABX91_01795 [Nanoarchaeota archaeon]